MQHAHAPALQARAHADPGTGTKRPGFGYKLSTLNAYRDALESQVARAEGASA
jgi:hypothetical protein